MEEEDLNQKGKLGRTTKKENLKTWEARRLRVRIESKKIEKARAEQEGIERNEKTERGWLENLGRSARF